MRGRRMWALLAVAAVLGMHGVQCLGDLVDPPHEIVAAVAADHGVVTVTDHGTHVVAPGAPGTGTTHRSTGPEHPPAHGADIWTLCVAALFAVLALLGVAAAARGRPGLVRRGPPSIPGLRHVHVPAPAPNLSALCLLRI